MSTIDWTQPAGEFSAKAPVTALLIGPHNMFVRNGLTLNDRKKIETFWVEDLTGFESPDIRVSSQENVQQDGGIPDPGFYGERTMTLTGWVQAGSYTRVLEMSRELLDSLIGLVETPMLITTWGGMLGDPSLGMFNMPEVTINCRPADKPMLSVKIEQNDQTGIFKRSFTIALRASSPYFLSTDLVTEELVPTIQAQRGRIYDRTYDLAYDTTLGLDGYPTTPGGTNELVIQNIGNYPATPVITFDGFISSAVLRNLTTDQVMYLTDYVANGDEVTVDTLSGLITDQDGENATALFDTRSDWIRVRGTRDPATGEAHSGENVFVLEGNSFGTSAKVQITWRHTWI